MLDEMLAEKLVLQRFLEAEVEEIGVEAVADLQGSHWANVGPDAKEAIEVDGADDAKETIGVGGVDVNGAAYVGMPKAVVGYLKSIEDCGRSSCCALESTQEPWPELFPDPDGGKGGDGGNHNVKVLPQEEVPCCGLVYYALVEAVEACVMLNPLPNNSQPDVDVLPDPGGRPKGQNNNPKDLAEA